MTRPSLLLAAILALCAAISSAPAARIASGPPVRVQARTVNRWYSQRRVRVKIRYPEVTGLPDRRLQSRINRLLRSAYPPDGLSSVLKDADQFLAKHSQDRGVQVHIDGDFGVTLNRDSILSIRYRGQWMPWQNGKQYAIHPDPFRAGISLDTRTGRPFRWRNLFARPDWRSELDLLIAQRARDLLQAERIAQRKTRAPLPPGQTLGFDDSDWTVEELLDDVQEHGYWYYLTPKGAVFYDLFTSYAIAGVEADLTYAQLRKLENPRGPLARLGR